MGLFGSVLGGALGIGGSIFGGLSASKAISNVKKNIQGQMAENQSWYDRRYNEDATQRADAQRILAITEENIRRRNRQAAGAAAVSGATDESVAQAKAAGNAAMAEAASQIATAGANRKDKIEEQYMERKNALNEQLNKMEMQKAGMISQAAQGVAQAAGNMSGLF